MTSQVGSRSDDINNGPGSGLLEEKAVKIDLLLKVIYFDLESEKGTNICEIREPANNFFI